MSNPEQVRSGTAGSGGGRARALLTAPLNPVGREPELRQLRDAFDAAAAGARRVVLVTGTAGVGKSSLIHELRPLAESRGGHFIAGKFDQHNEREAAALVQALSTLGRLLLAEPDEEERVHIRGRILRALGAQAGLARVVPEFELLLGDVPDPRAVDPAHAAARMAEVVVGLLRAVASPARPLILVLDDLQWSGALSARLIDAVLVAPDLSGLLLVAAYRDDELPPGHPLPGALARWAEEGSGAQLLRLANLPETEMAHLLVLMLRMPPDAALRLACALAPYGGGNPYDTVELVNALRDEGFGSGTPAGHAWNADWNVQAVDRFLRRVNVRQVLAARIARLPAGARELVQALACMGTQTTRESARAALGLGPGGFDAALTALLERGFVLRDGSDTLLRLRHDRIQQAAYASVPRVSRGCLHRALARRLAAHESLAADAAEQYVMAVDEIDDATECARAAQLLRAAASQARLIGNHVAAYRMLNAALTLLERAHGAPQGDAQAPAACHVESQALADCEIDYHLALCSIGRLVEADAIYRRIEERHAGALAIVDAACAQVSSLANRDLMDEALDLGLRVLRDLGLDAPRRLQGQADFSVQFEQLRSWVAGFDLPRETTRPEADDLRIVACGKVIARLVSPAAFISVDMLAWLVFQSRSLWDEHGPCAPLAVGFARAGVVSIALSHDWRTGYLAVRQALDLCEARGWEPEASHVRYVYGLSVIHWFEPLERTLSESERAREGLLAGGDLRNASFSYRHSALSLFECGAPVRRYAEEVEAAMALARRAGNRQAINRCRSDRKVLRALQEAGAYPAALEEGEDAASRAIDGGAPQAAAGGGWVDAYEASWCSVVCAIFGDEEALPRYARRAMDLRGTFQSFYPVVWAFWLQGLGDAWNLRHAEPGSERAEELLRELDGCIEWLHQRAIDAPFNFRHLHLHLQAERAWALGDMDIAVLRFDEALGAVEQTSRRWHRALIAERAARLALSRGCTHAGSQMLLEAQRLYAEWGAAAKSAQLAAQTGVADVRVAQEGASMTARSGDIDMLAVLRASQALALERNPARRKARVEAVLGSMTGATQVVLAQWDDEAGGWAVGVAEGTAWASPDALSKLLPLSACRYARRTREPLLLTDALADDRFRHDEYFAGMARCSLMVVPIVRDGAVCAMLVLRNTARRDAFSAGRLDAVKMIAGQLAASLESAQLYERLERKVTEQTRQLREAQARLVEEARRAGMSQIAANVLHNVGNVLTSVNVSAHLLVNRVSESRTSRIGHIAQLLEENASCYDTFFGEHGKGRLLPGYVRQLSAVLDGEREELLAELDRITGSVGSIANVVALQQSYACAGAQPPGGQSPD